MALAGVSDVYASGSELLKAFLGLDIAAGQLYRVTNYLGEQITTDLIQPVEHPPLANDELIYASVDGSMILTDSGWQEVKVGRIFTSEAQLGWPPAAVWPVSKSDVPGVSMRNTATNGNGLGSQRW